MRAKSSIVRVAVIGCLSLAVAMGIGRFAFTPLLPMMQDDGVVSISEGGLLASGHFLGYLLGALFAGPMIHAPRAALRLSLAAIGLCTLSMGVADSFAAMLALRWMAGFASALVLVLVGNFYLRYLTQAGCAACQGWVFSGVGAGIVAVGLACLVLMEMRVGSFESWRLIGAASLLVAGVICLSVGPEVPRARRLVEIGGAARSPLDRLAILAYGAAGMGYVVPATYLPVMAREAIQSPSVFGWSWPIFGLAAFLSTPLAARLQRRFTGRAIWAVSQSVMAVGIVLPAAFGHIAAIVLAGFCVGGTFMIVTMAGLKEAHRAAGVEDSVRHVAAMTTAFAAGQMIGPVLSGYLHDITHGFAAPLAATGAALAVTAALLTMRRFTRESLRHEIVPE